MKRKNTHNRRKKTIHEKTNAPIQIVLTMPTLRLLKDSLANFEMLLLAHGNQSIPNLEFAHLTFDQLKEKLTDMLEREEWEETKSFDYNELWILYTSLAMYILELQLKTENNTTKLPLCLKLCNQFSAMIKQAK